VRHIRATPAAAVGARRAGFAVLVGAGAGTAMAGTAMAGTAMRALAIPFTDLEVRTGTTTAHTPPRPAAFVTPVNLVGAWAAEAAEAAEAAVMPPRAVAAMAVRAVAV
jgi:hypothetical protein